MNLHDLFTLMSLGLTPLTITTCFAVIFMWWKAAHKALLKTDKTEVSWIILGVVIGFSGSLFDNLYWGAAWTADYAHYSFRDSLFYGGVYPNTFFRQSATILAAFCHIKAGMVTGDKVLRYALYIGSTFGIILTIGLYASVNWF